MTISSPASIRDKVTETSVLTERRSGRFLKRTIRLFLKYKLWLLAVLKPLGVWGVGCIALIDAAAVPVPIDFILAGYIWEDKRHFYLYVIIAALGSAVGGLLPFLLGRLGG